MAKTYSMQFGVGDPRTYTGLNPTLLIFVNISSGATLVAPTLSEALTGSGIYKFAYGTTTPIAFLADAATTGPGAAGRYVVGQIDPADRSDEYGNSIVAFGSTLVGYGSTLVGYGTTSIALGTTAVALGTSTVAFGSTLIGYGTTIIAIGTSTISFGATLVGFGTSLTQSQTNIGTTLVGIGNSLIAIGSTLGVGFAGVGSTASSFGTSSADPVDLFGYLKRIQENLEGNSTFVKVSGAWSIYNRGSSTLLVAKTVANSSSQVVKT